MFWLNFWTVRCWIVWYQNRIDFQFQVEFASTCYSVHYIYFCSRFCWCRFTRVQFHIRLVLIFIFHFCFVIVRVDYTFVKTHNSILHLASLRFQFLFKWSFSHNLMYRYRNTFEVLLIFAMVFPLLTIITIRFDCQWCLVHW